MMTLTSGTKTFTTDDLAAEFVNQGPSAWFHGIDKEAVSLLCAGSGIDGLEDDEEFAGDVVDEVAFAMEPLVVDRVGNLQVTAVVTGTGDESTVPDDRTAVDADIFVDGQRLTSVTLREDHTGRLAIWGEPDMWCADPEKLPTMDGNDGTNFVGEVVAAVLKASA